MKIVQLLPELNEGGVERGVVEINREFSIRGIESHVISRGGKLVETIVKDGGEHHSFDVASKNIWTVPGRIRGLQQIISGLKPDVIHARSRVPAWLVYFANRKLEIPFVTTVHGLNSVNRYSKIMTSGERVICVSEVVRDHVIKNYQVDPQKLRVIQRGVDMEYFDPSRVDPDKVSELKSEFNLQSRIVITSVGRITWLKDYETFIQSIAELSKVNNQVVGLIVGGYRQDKSEYFQKLKSLADSLGMAEHIVFAGSQSDMRSVYAASDIVVNASLKMGNMGRTVVEALAMGKPVVATTFDGLVNLVKDHINGRVIANQDPVGMSEAIQSILNMSIPADNIRSSVPYEYTLPCMIDQIIEVYRELIHAG